MPKYDLDKTWELCLEMWVGWIKKRIEADSELDVVELKDEWLKDNSFEDILDNCFFCEYVRIEEQDEGSCGKCPGRLVDPAFDCTDDDYDYLFKPLAFCQKLLELNKKRKG